MIRVEHLRKIYRTGKEKVRALDDVSLELAKGEFCCIVIDIRIATLLNQLAGLEKPHPRDGDHRREEHLGDG